MMHDMLGAILCAFLATSVTTSAASLTRTTLDSRLEQSDADITVHVVFGNHLVRVHASMILSRSEEPSLTLTSCTSDERCPSVLYHTVFYKL